MGKLYLYSDTMHEVGPVYFINGATFCARMLTPVKFTSLEESSLFRLSYEEERDWSCSPVYIRTEYGHCIVELNRGNITFVSISTRRLLDSKIEELFMIQVPEFSNGDIDRAYLPTPCLKMWTILINMMKFGITFNEFFGKKKIIETYNKIPLKKVSKMFKENTIQKVKKIGYGSVGNVVLLILTSSGEEKVTLAHYTKTSQKYIEAKQIDSLETIE